VEEEESLTVPSASYNLDCPNDALGMKNSGTTSLGSDVANSSDGHSEQQEDVVPSAGYNLDFLNDPNFNPFVTKSSGVRNSFETSQPEPLVATAAANDQPKEEVAPAAVVATKPAKPAPSKAPPSSGSSDAPAKEEKKRKPLPPKPWLKKKVSAAAKQKDEEDIVIFMSDKKSGTNKEEILEEAKPKEEQLPSQSRPAASANTIEKVVAKEADQVPVATAVSNSPPLRRNAVPKSYGYNVNFDDPNFNPFETKSKVVNNFEDKVSILKNFLEPSLMNK